ncbi:MAG TPA: hypothetical protein VF611_06960 [Pyrinomonadaceae bacterium]|jgi:hypothetical protein
MNAKSLSKGLMLAAVLAACGAASAQDGARRRVEVTVRPAQSAEERVADEVKEKRLRRAAEEKLAAEESARVAAASPKALLGRARTFYVESGTSYFEPVQLQNALRAREELEAWGMVILDGHDRRGVADLIVEIDRPLFTFTFTYKVTDRDTGVLLAAGKVTALDGNAAAPKLAAKVVEAMRSARGETKGGK